MKNNCLWPTVCSLPATGVWLQSVFAVCNRQTCTNPHIPPLGDDIFLNVMPHTEFKQRSEFKPDIRGSVHRDIIYENANKMQLCRIIYYSLAALHVSCDIFAHHQEHLNCIYSFWYYTRMLLPVGIMGESERQDNLLFLGCSTCFERYSCSSSGASKLYLQLLVLHTYVAAGWYHGRVETSG